MDLLDFVLEATDEYIQKIPKTLRKKYGQFFTSKETAVFMANLFSIQKKKELTILDAGAGSGILAVALIERLKKEKTVKKIKLICYENDNKIVSLLKANLDWICEHTSEIDIKYEIYQENYIVSQAEKYNSEQITSRKYDLIIGNPPYMKIGKDAPEAKVMQDVCYGAPNLYFLFAAMSIFNLVNNGEMVYIIPRSWASGAYFRKFREKLLSEVSIRHIHLFISRDKVFDKENVLQETIIIKVKKTQKTQKQIVITTSKSNRDFTNITTFKVPYKAVVAGKNNYVYLVTNSEDAKVIDQIHRWNNTLTELGIPMKTGLTVDFRNREYLRNSAEEKALPLFWSQHIRDGKIVFPVGKDNEYIITEQNGLKQQNLNYLFVKRFTAKEEHRRLQSGIYLSRNFPQYEKISTDNKINFIGGVKNEAENIIYGLYVLFNSSLYDNYYRILNGSTQVNATEINSMPIPSMEIIKQMGDDLIRIQNLSEATCNMILEKFFDEENRTSKANSRRIASTT